MLCPQSARDSCAPFQSLPPESPDKILDTKLAGCLKLGGSTNHKTAIHTKKKHHSDFLRLKHENPRIYFHDSQHWQQKNKYDTAILNINEKII
jgi:hypothetical protein